MGADDGRKVSGGIGTWRSDKRLVRQVIYFSISVDCFFLENMGAAIGSKIVRA